MFQILVVIRKAGGSNCSTKVLKFGTKMQADAACANLIRRHQYNSDNNRDVIYEITKLY